MWNDLDCSPKAAAYWRRSSPTVIRRGLLALCPKCNIASCLSLVVNEERQQGEEARQFRAGGRGIERDIDVRVFGRDAAVQPRKGVGEDADNLVPPLVGGHLLRIDWNRVPGHRARLWEVLTRPWWSWRSGIGRRRHDGAGYWIGEQRHSEVAGEGSESNLLFASRGRRAERQRV